MIVITLIIGLFCADFSGRVEKVIDGDTVSVRREADSARVTVRLYGIDAPEMQQPRGDSSRRALVALVDTHKVRCVYEHRDVYGRTVARVYVDSVDVALPMLRGGEAYAYPRYCKDSAYYRAEAEARRERRGVWSDTASVLPWIYRREK